MRRGGVAADSSAAAGVGAAAGGGARAAAPAFDADLFNGRRAVGIDAIACGAPLMVLTCELRVRAASNVTVAPSRASIYYYPATTAAGAARRVCLPAFELLARTTNARLHRLRPGVEYELELRANFGPALSISARDRRRFTPPRMGVRVFDAGRLAHAVAGSFSFEVAVTAFSSGEFKGLVGLDADGFITLAGRA